MTSEQVFDGVKAQFVSRFDALRAIYALEVSDTIPNYKTLEVGDIMVPTFPSIEILPSSTEVQLYDGQVYDDGIEEYVISLHIMHSGSFTQTVTKLLLRYREIIKRMVQEDRTFGERFYMVRLGRSDWAPMMRSREAKTFAQEMFQDLLVRVAY